METLHSWRDLDEAISSGHWGRHAEHARPTLVFRGLARTSYSNVSSLARVSDEFPALERHLIRNFRPGGARTDDLGLTSASSARAP